LIVRLAEICSANLLREKILVVPSLAIGHQIADAIAHGTAAPTRPPSTAARPRWARAIERFARPVAWQKAPDAVLPDELKESNPLGIRRMVDGEF